MNLERKLVHLCSIGLKPPTIKHAKGLSLMGGVGGLPRWDRLCMHQTLDQEEGHMSSLRDPSPSNITWHHENKDAGFKSWLI